LSKDSANSNPPSNSNSNNEANLAANSATSEGVNTNKESENNNKSLKPFQTTKLNQNLSSSWSSLKQTMNNAASTETKPLKNAVDSFHKYKMQMMQNKEMERLREQENLKSQKEQTASSTQSNIENRSSPMNPISPMNHQPSSVPNSDIDSNSQFSPPSPSTLPQANNGSTTSNQITKGSSSNDASSDELKRAQSIREMREKERRRREEIAGQIDMNEQHKLMAQFEQNLMPPSN
jgi:hypothetical protein